MFCSERTASTLKQVRLLITSETNIKKSKQKLMGSCLEILKSNDSWQLLSKTSKWVRTWNFNRLCQLLFDLILNMNLNHLVMFSLQTVRDLSKRRRQSHSSHLKRSKKPTKTSSQYKQRKMTMAFSNTLGGIRSKRSWQMLPSRSQPSWTLDLWLFEDTRNQHQHFLKSTPNDFQETQQVFNPLNWYCPMIHYLHIKFKSCPMKMQTSLKKHQSYICQQLDHLLIDHLQSEIKTKQPIWTHIQRLIPLLNISLIKRSTQAWDT